MCIRDRDGIVRRINEKVDSVTCEDETTGEELRRILVKCKNVFRESPGRMDCYEHEFRVTDKTPYFQRGWPIPIAVSYTHLDVYKRQATHRPTRQR